MHNNCRPSQLSPTAAVSLHSSSDMAHCLNPACHQMGSSAGHLLILDGVASKAAAPSAWVSTIEYKPRLTLKPVACRDSKAPFTFVVQLMVPGPPFLSLTMAWAADYDPSKPMSSETPQSQTDGSPTFSGNDGDSDSELVKSPFDLCLARLVATFFCCMA